MYGGHKAIMGVSLFVLVVSQAIFFRKFILEYFHLHSMQWEKYIFAVFIPVHSSFSLIVIGGGATNSVGLISVLYHGKH